MKQEDYDFFRDNGYLSLGKILSDAELVRFGKAFERDRRDFTRFWNENGIWQTQNCDALLTAPEFDGIIRHHRVLEPLGVLMGDEVCFSEICLRHMDPYAGEPIPGMTSWDGGVGRRWHRDGGDRFIWPEHPLRIGYVQLMVYLTDVSAATHSFSVSPEPVGEEILDRDAQLERCGVSDLHGCAGTAILFNVSRLHTVTVRHTRFERKSVQIYYGHRQRPFLSDQSYIPAALWRVHADEEVRGFYGVLNDRTRKYLERTGGREEIPVEEGMEILANIEEG
jgi:hypothetical protein